MRLIFLDTREIDDEGEYWERWIIKEKCGLDLDMYRSNPKVLTMRILESHLEEILHDIKNLKKGMTNPEAEYATIAVGYQILALLILETGSFLPDIVRQEVLKSTIWEYDYKQWRWGSNTIESRKTFLEKFREALDHYIPGERYFIYDHY